MITGQAESGTTEVIKAEVEFVVEDAMVEEVAVESWDEVIAGGGGEEEYVIEADIELLPLSEELRARELNPGKVHTWSCNSK